MTVIKSLDTTILPYAADEDCRQHAAAIGLVNGALRSPADRLRSDQVPYGLSAGLRHPRVFAKPLSAAEAAWRVAFLRRGPVFVFRCHERRSWPTTHSALAMPNFPRRRTDEPVRAVTLRSRGVKEFHTRSAASFRTAGFQSVVSPID